MTEPTITPNERRVLLTIKTANGWINTREIAERVGDTYASVLGCIYRIREKTGEAYIQSSTQPGFGRGYCYVGPEALPAVQRRASQPPVDSDAPARCDAQEMATQNELSALMRYGRKHNGLPNWTREMCAAKCREMGV